MSSFLSAALNEHKGEKFATASAQSPAREARAFPNPDYFVRWPTISARNVRRSRRVRFFAIAGVSNERCGISQRYSAMNQIGFSVVIQFLLSKRARFTGRE